MMSLDAILNHRGHPTLAYLLFRMLGAYRLRICGFGEPLHNSILILGPREDIGGGGAKLVLLVLSCLSIMRFDGGGSP